MKKTIYFVFCAIMLLVVGFFSSASGVAFADLPQGITVNSLDIQLYDSMSNSLPLSQGGVANLDFQNFDENEPISTSNNPYGTYYIGITVNTRPTIYENLDEDQKLTIYGDVTGNISINGSPVNLENNQATSAGNYILFTQTTPDYYSTYGKIFIRIVPIKAGSTIIECSVYDQTAQLTLNCEYATPSALTLEYDDTLKNQLLESFQPITFTVTPNYLDWLDNSQTITYEWTLNSKVITNQTSNTFTLTEDMIAVGEYTISVIVPSTTLQASETITIGTEIDYIVKIAHDSSLDIYYEDPHPINFSASIPVQDSYEIDWYVKTSDSSVYEYEQTSQNFGFQYITPGEYKVFAVARLNSNSYYSPVQVVTIHPQKVQGQTLNLIIVENVIENKYTGLTSYEFSIQSQDENISVEDYFLPSQIEWYVKDTSEQLPVRAQVGYTFTFNPTETQEYIITLSTRDGGTTIPLVQTSVTPRRVGQVVDIWIYIIIAVAVILIIGVASIIISNKAREKIW